MQWFKFDTDYNKDLFDIMLVIHNSMNQTFEYFYSNTFLKDKISLINNILTIDAQEFNLDHYHKIGICGIGKAVTTTIHYLDTLLKPLTKPWAIIPEDTITTAELTTKNIDFLPGSHPLPSTCTFQSTEEFLKRLSMFMSKDIVFVVISGGASSVFALPHTSLT